MTKRFGAWLALAAVLIYALVLRPPLAAVGPLLPLIDQDLGLSLAQQGFLTAIPVFAFGVGAFAGPALAKRLGLERSLFWLLALLTLAMTLRGWFGFTSLVIGTTVAGLAIAVSNVLLPSVIRGRFAKHVPQVTALFTTVLAISASVAAASAVPIEAALGNWNLTLMVWLAPAALALALWKLALKNPVQSEPSPHQFETHEMRGVSRDFGLVLRSRVTWAIFGFFGIQSAGFYVLLSWLPTVLIERGYTPEAAGSLLGLATIVGVPTGLLLASSFAKIKRLDWLALAVSLVTSVGFLALELEQSLLACILIGLGQAATFPLSLTMISTKADKAITPTLSATTQGLGYVFAGIVAFSMAGIREASGGWSVGIWIIFALTLVQAFCGFAADRAKPIKAA